MVVKIMKSTGSMRSPLEYNESKVRNGVAEVVGVENMDASASPVEDTFRRYEASNIRSRDVSFHMSFNPGPGEMEDEGQVCACIGELMEGLGYGDQPYVIYRHEDIGRRHYHVVSIRTDPDGKKIRDYYENRHCNNLLQELSSRYGFTVGREEVRPEISGGSPSRFDPSRSGIMDQLSRIARTCCGYSFITDVQFRSLMREYGVKVSSGSSSPGRLLLQGLDRQGRPCTGVFTENDLKMDLGRMVRERLDASLKSRDGLAHVRQSLEKEVEACLTSSSSEKAFRALLASGAVTCDVRRDDARKITGASFTDHASGSVFDLSEFRTIGLHDMRAVDEEVWSHHEPSLGEKAAGLLAEALSSAGEGRSREHDMRNPARNRRTRRR